MRLTIKTLGRRWRGMLGLTTLLGVGLAWWPYALIGAGYSFLYSEAGIVAVRKNLEDVRWYQDANGSAVVLVKDNGARWMMHDGYPSLLFDGSGRLVYQESLIGAGLTALLPESKRNKALVLGFGTGISAGVIAAHFAQVTVYEIRPAMLALARGNFAKNNRGVLDRANVTIKLQDGVLGAASNNVKYDGIWVNVPSPGMRGAEKILATETLVTLKHSLSDDGLVFFWMHTGMGRPALAVLNHTVTQTLGPCRYFLLGPRYLQLVCAPGMTRHAFMAMPVHQLGDYAVYADMDFGAAVAASELRPVDPGWDSQAPLHSYDKPWFDTRALYIAHFDPKLQARVSKLFEPRYPKRFCSLMVDTGFRWFSWQICG